MKIKLLGIGRKDYDFDGIKFNGNYLYCAVKDQDVDGLVGDTVTTIKIPDGHHLAKVPLEVGKTYTAYFDDKKKLDYLAEVTSK